MVRTACPLATWTLIATGVTELNFNLVNYPDTTAKRAYFVATGASAPANEDDALYYDLDGKYNEAISFNNSVATNVYVKAVYSAGAVII